MLRTVRVIMKVITPTTPAIVAELLVLLPVRSWDLLYTQADRPAAMNSEITKEDIISVIINNLWSFGYNKREWM